WSSVAPSFTLIFTNQPRPYGSSPIRAAFSARAAFVSATSPSTGAYRSLTALTDSTSPNGWPAVTFLPTGGSSTCVTSVSRSTANWVMPTVQTPLSSLAHSWDGEYRSAGGTITPPM